MKSRRVFDSINKSDEKECDSLLETEEIIFFMKLILSTKKLVKKTEKLSILFDNGYCKIFEIKYSKETKINGRLAVSITQSFMSVSDRKERSAYNKILTNLILGESEFAEMGLNPFTIPTPNEERCYDCSFEKMSIIKCLISENPL